MRHLDEFFDLQQARVIKTLRQHEQRVRDRREQRRQETQDKFEQMDFEHRLDIILHGGMGPRRKNLSQLDGDFE